MSRILLAAGKAQIDNYYMPGSPHPTNYGQLLTPLINNALIIIGITGFFFIIFAGFTYITASGDKNKTTQASTMLNYTLIGLALAGAAYVITKLMGQLTGFNFFKPI